MSDFRKGLMVVLGVGMLMLEGFVFGGGTARATGAPSRAYSLRAQVTLKTKKINGSKVHVAIAPLSMVEALPGCAKFPCGRQTSMLPSVNGARHGSSVSIGGDFIRDGRPIHAYVHNGEVRSRGIRNGDVFRLDEDGTAEIRRGRDRLLAGAEELFGGYPQVLHRGNVPSDRGDCKNDDGPDGAFCLRQPRQGIGLTRDGQSVVVIEVDGRQRGSRGMLLPEFGRTFKRFGAWSALNVDGGGSAVMWTRKRTRACDKNRPTGCLVTEPVYGERRITQSIALVP